MPTNAGGPSRLPQVMGKRVHRDRQLCCAGASQALSAHIATFLFQLVSFPTPSVCSASHHNQQPSHPMASAFLSSVLPRHRPGWQQELCEWSGAAAHASMDLVQRCRLPHIQRLCYDMSFTKVHSQSSTGGLSSVDPSQSCCRHRSQPRPNGGLVPFPELQEKPSKGL